MAQLASFSPTPPSPPFPLAPLSFSSVYPSYTTTSSFPLFALPADIWPLVMRYLSTTDLRSLAHVDRDCRKLAELRVWRDLKADFGRGSYGVLGSLTKDEARERARCVRQVYVGPPSEPPYTIRERGGLINTETQPTIKPQNPKKYLARLLHTIEHCLPHLYVMEWNLPGPLTPAIVHAMRASGVRHLRVCNAVFGEDFLLPASSEEEREGTKEKEKGGEGGGQVGARVARDRGMEHVRLGGHLLGPVLLPPSSEDPDDENDNADTLPDFPNLRTLVLDRASPDPTTLLHNLLGEKTRISTLALDSAMPATASFLLTRGYVSSLKAFAWANTRAVEGSERDVIKFLEENDHLETFEMTSGVDAEWVEGALLPLLGSFESLTALKLVFSGSSIPESSLASLASLTSLQTLHISAGPNHPSTPTWHPSHSSLLALLAPLKCLRRLAFTRDTNAVTAHPLAPRREGGGGYYRKVRGCASTSGWTTAAPVSVLVLRLVSPRAREADGATAGVHVQPAEESHERRRIREAQDELATLAWERWHAAQMRRVVQSYAEAFEWLEWCFVGQLGFGVEGVYEKGTRKERKVYPESEDEEERRDPCGTTVERRMGVACREMWSPCHTRALHSNVCIHLFQHPKALTKRTQTDACTHVKHVPPPLFCAVQLRVEGREGSGWNELSHRPTSTISASRTAEQRGRHLRGEACGRVLGRGLRKGQYDSMKRDRPLLTFHLAPVVRPPLLTTEDVDGG
ncbi:hypothetical protein NLJ89_g11385 [Agrocybe chaxingu]|uniref:F-box domain-containing protein n=1 Tax=Agrocybe chaxingu TaxID=84603 RepID=A0A9W8JWE2_9AGAR|nr:hypothetical protein NLJ89_g11385 [Agrocybe chaxingu]